MTDREKLAAIENLLVYHETGGHEGDGSDHALSQARAALEALRTPQAGDELAMELAEHIANLDKPGLDAFIAAQGPAVSWFLRNRQRILAALTPTNTDAEQVKEAAAKQAEGPSRELDAEIALLRARSHNHDD